MHSLRSASFANDIDNHYLFSPSQDLVVAVGGEFSAGLLLSAYEQGIFPWGRNQAGQLLWCSPNPRCVMMPNDLIINKTTQKIIKRKPYRIVLNDPFTPIIELCAKHPRKMQGNDSWIDDSFIWAYTQLHYLGFAHSVSVYEEQQLVGGLYGLMLGSVFFGESMISLRPNASKLAFIYLTQYLTKKNILTLIDAQQASNHLLTWGAKEIAITTFKSHLQLHANRSSTVHLEQRVELCY